MVTELAVTVLKGGRLAHPEEILLEDDGVADDRRFFVISTTGKQLDAVKGTLNVVFLRMDLRRPSADAASAHRDH